MDIHANYGVDIFFASILFVEEYPRISWGFQLIKVLFQPFPTIMAA